MPVPAEPRVEKGEMSLFVKATEMLNWNANRSGYGRGSRTFDREGTAAPVPAGEITFHERIGAHDISVVRVNDRASFVGWVTTYLRKAGVDHPVIPNTMIGNVEEYLSEGFSWFVFDVVSLQASPRTNEAIQYRFETNRIFYPLKISRTGQGQTSVDILILTYPLHAKFLGLPEHNVKKIYSMFVDQSALDQLDAAFPYFFRHESNALLSLWRIQGDLKSFDKDLIVTDTE